MKTNIELARIIEATSARSAWRKGVKAYALEMLESAEDGFSLASLLNGAESWRAYSYGGCALIYDADIAERLCSPSEYRKTRQGERAPNSRETWLDCQARACGQAANLIASAVRKEAK